MAGDGANACHERARRAVFGYLASAVLHETNNVLTVMAGVRQLLRSGQPLSERVGTMIDQQLARMEELVGAIRRVGPEDADPAKTPREIGFVLGAVERIVQLAGKGRGLAIERQPPAAEAMPADAEALALATLLVVLPALPARGRPAGTRVVLRGDAGANEVRVEVTLAPAESDAADEPEAGSARKLLERVGGRIETRLKDGTLAATIAVPRG